jgi:hypothetical protein
LPSGRHAPSGLRRARRFTGNSAALFFGFQQRQLDVRQAMLTFEKPVVHFIESAAKLTI